LTVFSVPKGRKVQVRFCYEHIFFMASSLPRSVQLHIIGQLLFKRFDLAKAKSIILLYLLAKAEGN
jgi:hypothetical protein